MSSHYQILGVAKDASLKEIKAAYRRQALRYHPDKNPGSEDAGKKFLEVYNAYEILSDPLKRQLYDEKLFYKETNYAADAYRRTARPVYTYTYQKVEYTRQAYIYAGLFIVGLLTFAILFPLFLMKRSASIYFDKGIEYYQSGLYMSALESFNKSMNDLGGKNGAPPAEIARQILSQLLDRVSREV